MSELEMRGYAVLLERVKSEVQSARTRAALAVNRELVELYWRLGRLILDRQDVETYGTKVIDRLSADLRVAFPEMRGLGRRNLHYMRSFAEAWPDVEVVQRLIAQLPWGHNVELLSALDAPSDRVWYADQAIAHGWSRNVLAAQIMSKLHLRSGAAPSNFSAALPPAESELVQQLIKDPYRLDFPRSARRRPPWQPTVHHQRTRANSSMNGGNGEPPGSEGATGVQSDADESEWMLRLRPRVRCWARERGAEAR